MPILFFKLFNILLSISTGFVFSKYNALLFVYRVLLLSDKLNQSDGSIPCSVPRGSFPLSWQPLLPLAVCPYCPSLPLTLITRLTGLSGGEAAGITISLLLLVTVVVIVVVVLFMFWRSSRYYSRTLPPPSRKGSMRLTESQKVCSGCGL